MIDDDPLNLVQFAGGETKIGGQENRVEPELGLIPGCFDVNVWWFLAFVTKEVESEPADT